jgi:hypothetical protein
MSVTFSIEAVTTGIFTGTCWESGDPVEAFRVSTYDAALEAMIAHKDACPECDAYGIYPSPVFDVEGHEVNLANANARHLAAVLGMDLGEELCGTMDAAEFAGYVLVALAQEHSPIAPYESNASILGVGPRVIDGGFDANRYLAPLADLAAEAQRLNRMICWS